MSTVDTLELLRTALSVSVGLRMLEIEREGEEEWWESIERNKDEWTDIIASEGDNILYKSKKSGGTARAFNALSKAVAHLAFMPGGIRVFDHHFAGNFPAQENTPKGTSRDESVMRGLLTKVTKREEESQ